MKDEKIDKEEKIPCDHSGMCPFYQNKYFSCTGFMNNQHGEVVSIGVLEPSGHIATLIRK